MLLDNTHAIKFSSPFYLNREVFLHRYYDAEYLELADIFTMLHSEAIQISGKCPLAVKDYSICNAADIPSWAERLQKAFAQAFAQVGASSAQLRSLIKELEPTGPCDIPWTQQTPDLNRLVKRKERDWEHAGGIILNDDSKLVDSAIQVQDLESDCWTGNVTKIADRISSITKGRCRLEARSPTPHFYHQTKPSKEDIVEKFRAFGRALNTISNEIAASPKMENAKEQPGEHIDGLDANLAKSITVETPIVTQDPSRLDNAIYMSQSIFTNYPFVPVQAGRYGKYWLLIPQRERKKLEYLIARAYNQLPRCHIFIQHTCAWVSIEALESEDIDYTIGFQYPGQTLLIFQGTNYFGLDACYDGRPICYMGCVASKGGMECSQLCTSAEDGRSLSGPPCHGLDVASIRSQGSTTPSTMSIRSAIMASAQTPQQQRPIISDINKKSQVLRTTLTQLATPRPSPDYRRSSELLETGSSKSFNPSSSASEEGQGSWSNSTQVNNETETTTKKQADRIEPLEERSPSNDHVMIFASNGREILPRNESKNTPSEGDEAGVPRETVTYATTLPRLPTVAISKLRISPREQEDQSKDYLAEELGPRCGSEQSLDSDTETMAEFDDLVQLFRPPNRALAGPHKDKSSAAGSQARCDGYNIRLGHKTEGAEKAAPITFSSKATIGYSKPVERNRPAAKMATNSTNRKVERRCRPTAMSKEVQITKEGSNKRIEPVETPILADVDGQKCAHMQHDSKSETHVSTLVADTTQTIDLTREDVETAGFDRLNLQGPICYIDNIANKHETDGERLRAITSYCKMTFAGHFFTPTLGNADFVDSEETNIYFETWLNGRLSTSMVMQVLYLLSFSPNVFVAHSEDAIISPSSLRRKTPLWPKDSKHTHVILPSCHEHHWTLFCVDKISKEILHYDSNPGSERAQTNFLRDMEAHIKRCIHGNYKKPQKYTVRNVVSSIINFSNGCY